MTYDDLAAKLTPVTARPFKSGYKEYMPCEPLRPFIRCFWTSEGKSGSLVIPDLCSDVIFNIGDSEAFFCAVSDAPFYAADEKTSFGIRFYEWTAALFSEDTLRGTLNGCFELGAHFLRMERELAPRIFAAETPQQRIELSERFLLDNLHERKNKLFIQAAGEMILRRGACTSEEISKELYISRRQLERIFAEYSGLSPKKTAALVRYQCLWNDILARRDFSTAEKASEYGYADQSHLLKDFGRFHTMPPKQAIKYAFDE